MKLDVPIKAIKTDIDVSELQRICAEFSDMNWSAWQFRQATFDSHRSTDTIPFVWTNNEGDGELPQFTNQNHPAWQAISPHVQWLEQFFDGAVSKVMLAKLLPNKQVGRHVDGGHLLPLVHRCHLPVKTNNAVEFFIDDVPHFLEPGTWYEIDNTRPHEVRNNSAVDRVHLIVDILPNRSEVV
jgi:hypothetical protein